MVVSDSSSTVYDVVFVVETTANLGAYIDHLKTSYIQPALEHFNGGPPEEIDYGCQHSCSLYGLVSYNGPDCAPEPSSRCAEPTTSIHQFLKDLLALPYVGGCGDGTTFLSEGLATALHLFDDLKSLRDSNISTQKHCILLCNSAPSVLPSQESINYNGFMAEDLIHKLNQRDIHFSIISPRKIPGLYGLYDKNLTDHQLNTGKHYAVDSRHLVLLKGFQLEERPISPGAKIEEPPTEKPAQGPSQRFVPPPQSSSQPFKVPNPTPGGQMDKNQYSGAKKTALNIVEHTRNRGQTSQPGGTDDMNNQNPQVNVSIACSTPNYPQNTPPNPVMHPNPNSMGGMRQPGMSNMGPGNPYPGNMQPNVGMGPGNNMGPHGSAGPNVPMPQMGPGGPQGGTQQDVLSAMSDNVTMQHRNIIWKGTLEWQEKTKQQTPQGPVDTGNKISRTLGCHVSLGNGEANINAVQWPGKLQMQLIPQTLLQPLHGLFKNSRTVSFTFANHDVDGLRSLYKVMASGFAGCVHIPPSAQSDVRVLMLLYSNRKKQFMGLIPNDQAQFINGIRTVITTQRQMHHKKMQGPGVPGQPPFAGGQPNMSNPGQVGMGMPNVSMNEPANSQGMTGQPSAMNMPAAGQQQSHSNNMVTMANTSLPVTTGMAGSSDMMTGGLMSSQQQPQQPQGQPQQPGPGMKGQQQGQQGQNMAQGVLSQEEIERRANLKRIEALKKNLNDLEAKEIRFQQQQQQQRQMLVTGSNSFGGQAGPGQQAPQGLTPQQQLQRLQQQQALQSSNPQLRHLLLNQQQMRQQQMMPGQQTRGMAPPPQGMMNQQMPNMGAQMQQRPPNFGVNDNFDLMN